MRTNFASGEVTIDGWLRFAAPGRVVALVQGLRSEVDRLLARKMQDPSFDLHSSAVLEVMARLVASDGLGSSTSRE